MVLAFGVLNHFAQLSGAIVAFFRSRVPRNRC
jgi:hypothetical protein